MKKKIVFVKLLLGCSLMVPCNVYARESESSTSVAYNTDDLVEDLFDGWDENKHVIRMEDGGYLQGQCTIVDTENPDIVYGYYDSETDENAMSVEEAMDEVRAVENGQIVMNTVQTRGAGVPSSTKVMPSGSHYTSQAFTSQAGWRFGGLLFQCASGSAGIQRWQTFGDSGRVGTLGDAINQLNNPSASFGFSIYPGSPMNLGTKYNWGYASYCYYSYAPAYGTYYRIDFS